VPAIMVIAGIGLFGWLVVQARRPRLSTTPGSRPSGEQPSPGAGPQVWEEA